MAICLAAAGLGDACSWDAPPEGSIKAIFAFRELDELWYPVKVENAEGLKTLVRYSDGTTEWKEKAKIIEYRLRLGAEVYGDRRKTGSYDPGMVTGIDGARIRINYRDGAVEDAALETIRMNLANVALLQVGVRVFARWDPDGYWYPASIAEIENHRYRVRFDDGQVVWRDASGLYKYAVTPGDRVEGNWIGQGRYYRGEVKTRKGKQIHIRYDDGDEENTTDDQVRMRLHVDAEVP